MQILQRIAFLCLVLLALALPGNHALAATDTFTRSNAIDLGSNWHRNTPSGWGITSNQAVTNGTSSDRVETWSADAFNANQYSAVKLVTFTGTSNQSGCGVSLRWDTGTVKTGYWVVVNTAGTNNVSIHRFNAGSATLLQQTTHTWTSGHELRAEISGYTITVKDDGTAFTSIEDTSGSKIASGQPGVAYSSALSAVCTADDWNADDLGGTIGALANVSPSLIPLVDLKSNTSQWLPFFLRDILDAYPVTGADGATISIYYRKNPSGFWTRLLTQNGDGAGTGQDCATDGTETPESGDVCESVSGNYRVYFPSAAFSALSRFTMLVTGTGLSSIFQDGVVKAYTASEESAQIGGTYDLASGPSGFSSIKNDTAATLQDTSTDGVKLNLSVASVTISSINTWRTGYGNLVVIAETGVITVDNQFNGYSLRCGAIEYRIHHTIASTRSLYLALDHLIPNTLTGTCDILQRTPA